MTSAYTPAAQPALWRTALDIESQSADHYRDNVNRPLLELIEGTPRRVLELGCAMGHCGEVLKAKYPGVSVVGIDANRAAAQAAERRLDRVI
jgi:trans-aconitate methyltransferase